MMRKRCKNAGVAAATAVVETPGRVAGKVVQPHVQDENQVQFTAEDEENMSGKARLRGVPVEFTVRWEAASDEAYCLYREACEDEDRRLPDPLYLEECSVEVRAGGLIGEASDDWIEDPDEAERRRVATRLIQEALAELEPKITARLAVE